MQGPDQIAKQQTDDHQHHWLLNKAVAVVFGKFEEGCQCVYVENIEQQLGEDNGAGPAIGRCIAVHHEKPDQAEQNYERKCDHQNQTRIHFNAVFAGESVVWLLEMLWQEVGAIDQRIVKPFHGRSGDPVVHGKIEIHAARRKKQAVRYQDARGITGWKMASDLKGVSCIEFVDLNQAGVIEIMRAR